MWLAAEAARLAKAGALTDKDVAKFKDAGMGFCGRLALGAAVSGQPRAPRPRAASAPPAPPDVVEGELDRFVRLAGSPAKAAIAQSPAATAAADAWVEHLLFEQAPPVATGTLIMWRTREEFAFAHRSFIDFFAALHIATELQATVHAAAGDEERERWARDARYVGGLGLTALTMTFSPGVLRFAADLVDPAVRDFHPTRGALAQPYGSALWMALYAARREPGEPAVADSIVRAAANAATVLAYAGVPFSGRNLRGLTLGHALGKDPSARFVVDLQGAVLSRTDLTNAQLRNVRLQHAMLQAAQLADAEFENVSFGELPRFRGHLEEVRALALHGSLVFSAGASNLIRGWDARTHQARPHWGARCVLLTL